MAPAGGFADFFPAAPRAAKVKAITRESKPKARDSSPASIVLGDHNASASLPDRGHENQNRTRDSRSNHTLSSPHHIARYAASAADSTRPLSGILPDGVDSTRSNSSGGSPTFSANGMSHHEPNTSVSTVTPPTMTDTSPPEVVLSPSRLKSEGHISRSHTLQPITFRDETSTAHHANNIPSSSQPLRSMRDAGRPLGVICTYDPILDTTLSKSAQKKAKATYREFGMVRLYSILSGERHLTIGEMFG